MTEGEPGDSLLSPPVAKRALMKRMNSLRSAWTTTKRRPPPYRVPPFIAPTNSRNAPSLAASSPRCAAILATTADPEITPTTPEVLAARTCAGVAMPNPSSGGGARRVINRPMSAAWSVAATLSTPVTPTRLTR